MLEEYNDILNIEELCDILTIGKNSAYSLLNTRQIKAFKQGSHWKVPKIAVIEYILNASHINNI